MRPIATFGLVLIAGVFAVETAPAQQVDCNSLLYEMRRIGPGPGSFERAVQLGNIYNNNCGRVRTLRSNARSV